MARVASISGVLYLAPFSPSKWALNDKNLLLFSNSTLFTSDLCRLRHNKEIIVDCTFINSENRTYLNTYPIPTHHPPGTLVYEMAAWKWWYYLSKKYCTECTVQWQSVYSTCVHFCPRDSLQDIYDIGRVDPIWTYVQTFVVFLLVLS